MVGRIRLPPVNVRWYRMIRTQARYDYVNRDDEFLTIPRPAALATPRQVRHRLSVYVKCLSEKIPLAAGSVS